MGGGAKKKSNICYHRRREKIYRKAYTDWVTKHFEPTMMNREMALKAIACARNGDKEGAAYCISKVDTPEGHADVFMNISDDRDKIIHGNKFITRAEMEAIQAVSNRVGITSIKTTLLI